jgi:hypothetical protein
VNGAESATLSVSDADGAQTATLKGTGIGATLAPTSLTFAAQDGGTTSAAKTLTLTNYLSSPLGITSVTLGGANATDFTVQASSTCPYPSGSLGASSNCTYNITFTPSVNGAESATLSVSDADGTQTATLKGTGIGATLAPTTLTFAAQDGGTTSAAKTLTLTNYLSSALAISVSFGGTNPGDFAASGSTCPYPTGNVGASSNCTYTITFTPSMNGAESATLVVTDADGTQTATLKGTGIGASIAPTTLTFAAQDGSTTSAAKTLTLTNYLSSSLAISATLGGANPSDFTVQASSTCPYPTGSLGANSSCTYNITFTPSVTGAESATLSVVDADGTQTATLKGTGIGAAFAPTSLTFAAQDGGTTSAAKTLTLTNYLSSALAISVSFGGANPGDFAVSGGTCPYPTGNVGASSNCTYTITFTPSVNGAESATLVVTDADGTQTATLMGTGIGAAIAPTTLTFAAQTKGTPSAAKTLTFNNYLSTSSGISASLGGTNPGDFTVQGSSTCPYPSGNVGANSSCTYNITFTPSVTGAESATLSVVDADGTQTATLKGTGK